MLEIKENQADLNKEVKKLQSDLNLANWSRISDLQKLIKHQEEEIEFLRGLIIKISGGDINGHA